MIKQNLSHINKGLFAIAVVAIAGIVGAVNFAQAAENDNTSGYGTTGEQAAAAADDFQSSVQIANNTFVPQVKALEATAKAQLEAGGVTDVNAFDASFDAATAEFDSTNNAAFAAFSAQVLAAANTAESKDQFIDKFNHAKADYLNQLDAAKNKLADSLSKLGNTGNVVKDQFMNGYNSDRDAFSNQLEVAKNEFAATVSNL